MASSAPMSVRTAASWDSFSARYEANVWRATRIGTTKSGTNTTP